MATRRFGAGPVPLCAQLVWCELQDMSKVKNAHTQTKTKEVFERSRSKSSPLEKSRSKLANPVELTGFDRG